MGKMGSVPVYALCAFLALTSWPTHATGPLALLGKQLLKQAVKDFFASELTSFAQDSLGPCKSMLASIPSGTSSQRLNPMLGQIAPAMMAQMDPAMLEEAAKAMAALQEMRSATPLSAAEVDELVDRLVRVSKAIPDHALPCTVEELKLVFGMSASMPMGAGPLRMMLVSFREMDDRCRKVHECFAEMSPAEEDEAIELIAAEVAAAKPEERKQMAGFLLTDVVCLPPRVRERLRARLASLR